jgi:hypothetical protein
MDREGTKAKVGLSAGADWYLQMAKSFENIAAAYRDVRVHGPANDAEARKGVCEFLVAARPER